MALYMKYDGIDGEATHSNHDKWIDVSAVAFGIGRSISTPAGATANRESSEPSVSEITIEKKMDASSSKLFTESATGNVGKTVKIDVVSTGSPGNTYTTYTLTNTLVSGYSVKTGGDRPVETLTLSFTKIEYKFIPYDANNKAGTPVTVSYDLATTKSG